MAKKKFRNVILFDRSALPDILRALNIKTDIPLDEIGAITKDKGVVRNDLLSLMELKIDECEEKEKKANGQA